MTRKQKIKYLIIYGVIMTILGLSCIFYSPINKALALSFRENYNTVSIHNNLLVHFIDVGQADAALVFSDDETMLIDGGNPQDSSLIAAYLKNYNISHLNYVVCSHAHDDHVGGLPGALSVATVDVVYTPKTENDIKAYQSFKSKVAAQDLSITNPSPGDTFKFGNSTVLFLGPVHENKTYR